MKHKIGNGELYLGNCLELMKDIPDHSIGMILCDLPYQITNNKWDIMLPFEDLWNNYWRILASNSAIVLTANQPFTSELIMSAKKYFKYEWIWEKNPVKFLNCKRSPLSSHESVLVFGKGNVTYYPQNLINKIQIHKRGLTKNNYNNAKNKNISYYTNYPRSILKFSDSNTKKIHPTQKPVALFEYLIKTYTVENDLVLDNCSGSGTTAIAAQNCNRRWICIEQNETYFNLSRQRIEDHINAPNLKDIF